MRYGAAPEWGHTTGAGLAGTLPGGIGALWTIAGFLRFKTTALRAPLARVSFFDSSVVGDYDDPDVTDSTPGCVLTFTPTQDSNAPILGSSSGPAPLAAHTSVMGDWRGRCVLGDRANAGVSDRGPHVDGSSISRRRIGTGLDPGIGIHAWRGVACCDWRDDLVSDLRPGRLDRAVSAQPGQHQRHRSSLGHGSDLDVQWGRVRGLPFGVPFRRRHGGRRRHGARQRRLGHPGVHRRRSGPAGSPGHG